MNDGALFFAAHPGHELRLFGWLRSARPTVCFLTDGSGSDGTPRLERTDALLAGLGAVPGPLYGVASDRVVYAALLGKDIPVFTELARRLGALLRSGNYSAIVGDAAEGYNPSHDVARMLVDAAVAIARAGGVHVDNYAFPLVGHPQKPPPACAAGPQPIRLDEATLDEKIETARAYARAAGGVLVSEVDEAIERFGLDAFRAEQLFVAGSGAQLEAVFDTERPFYETYGEQQVAAGRYSYVIRWDEHVRPIATALRELSASS